MKYNRPINQAKARDLYGSREVGLYHPDLYNYIKLNNRGQVEIFATAGVGIVLDSHTRSCNIYADNVKFFTKDIGGLRWNERAFNPEATDFKEPTFIEHLREDIVHHLDGWDDFLQED